MTLPKLRSTLARRHTRRFESYEVSNAKEHGALLAKAELIPDDLTADDIQALVALCQSLLGRMLTTRDINKLCND